MRTVAYCGDHVALTTTNWNDKIYVDTRDISLAPHIMLEGSWEPWVTNAVAQLLQQHPGCTFIDVGANVGWYTLLACKLGAGHVFAVEPNPRMFSLLRKSVIVNGYGARVTLEEAACGAQRGVLRLVVDPELAGGAHVAPYDPAILAVVDGPAVLAVVGAECSVVPLDEIVIDVLDACPGPIILKIDVEGYEPEVLAGAQELLKLRPSIFLEHNPSEKAAGLYADLLSRGYVLKHVQHSGHLSASLDHAAVCALAQTEMIFAEPVGRGRGVRVAR
jgi:FkbM family methyltransferase